MHATQSTGTSLFDVIYAVARRWRLSVAILLLSVGGTVAALWLLPRHYRSESKIYVRLGRESVSVDPTAVIGRSGTSSVPPSMRENEVNSVTEMLGSKVLLDHVVDAVGPAVVLADTDPSQPTDGLSSASIAKRSWQMAKQVANFAMGDNWSDKLSEHDQAVIKLQKAIDVFPVKKSDVIRVGCNAKDPHLAQALTNNLVEAYMAEHMRLNRTSGRA